MADTVLTADIIAREAVMQLDNNLVMANQVFRGYEEDFGMNVNGYEVGETISVKRPMDFTVRDGAVAVNQDVVEGKFTLSVNQQKGVDFDFTSRQLTMDINELSERVIQPAMIQLANDVDKSLMDLYKKVSNHVGAYTEIIDSNQDFSKGPERMDEGAVPTAQRSAVLAPRDHWGVVGAQTTLLNDRLVGDAYRNGSLGMISGMETFMAQNVPNHTAGANDGAGAVNGGSQEVTYDASKDTNTWSLITDGWTASDELKEGDIITIADVFAVNPVTKERKSYLKQFVVRADATEAVGAMTLSLSPAAITTGAFQTVSVDGDTIPDDAVINVVGGGAGDVSPQNLFFHRNAFALAMVPMIMPPGSVDGARETYKGTSARLVPYYDGTNDISNWRFDILYGVECIDERLAVRVNGTA